MQRVKIIERELKRILKMCFKRLLKFLKINANLCLKIATIFIFSITVYFVTILYAIFIMSVSTSVELFKSKRSRVNLRSHYKRIQLNPKSEQTNLSSEKPTVEANISEISINAPRTNDSGFCTGMEDSQRIDPKAGASKKSCETKQIPDDIGRRTNLTVHNLSLCKRDNTNGCVKSNARAKQNLSVTISNLELFSKDKNKKLMRYFVCHLQHKSVLQTSAIIEGKLRETVRFRDIFHFDDLEADFDIVLKIYSVEIVSNKFQRFLRSFRKTTKQPWFKDWGAKHIRIDHKSFTFEKQNQIIINFDINFLLVGYLNVAKCVDDCSGWTRYWCCLNDEYLAFWNSPVDQQFNNNAKDRLTLTKSMKIIETNVVSGLYRFSFVLLLCDDRSNSIKYFLSASTEDEIYYWKKYLKYALHK